MTAIKFTLSPAERMVYDILERCVQPFDVAVQAKVPLVKIVQDHYRQPLPAVLDRARLTKLDFLLLRQALPLVALECDFLEGARQKQDHALEEARGLLCAQVGVPLLRLQFQHQSPAQIAVALRQISTYWCTQGHTVCNGQSCSVDPRFKTSLRSHLHPSF